MRRFLLVAAIAALAAATAVVVRRRAAAIDRLTATIPGLHTHWQRRGKPGPDPAADLLYVALGDSAALGVGASEPDAGYVGLVAAEAARLTGRRVRVRNLAIDGSRVETVLNEQLGRLARLSPDLCTLAVGANDVWTYDEPTFRRELGLVLDALPPGSVVGDLPCFPGLPIDRTAAAASRVVAELVAERPLVLAPLRRTTRTGFVTAVRGSAPDLFHPNDAGYRRWAEAFLPPVRAALARFPPGPV